MDPAPAGAPVAARRLRGALLVLLAAGPAVWLLARPLARPGAIPGAPSAGIYAVLHQYWSETTAAPPRFPEAGAAPARDVLATLGAPLTAALGAPAVVALTLSLALAATLLVAWRYARRHAADPWTAAAAAAAFTTSPAVIAGVASGEPDAWHGWAVLAPALATGPAALAVGPAAALLAPSLVPVAFVPAALAAWRGEGRARLWPLAGLALGVAVRTPLGWPGLEGEYGWAAWFTHLDLPPSPERYSQVYVGFVAMALLLAGLARPAGRPFVGLAALALLASLQTASLPPERFLMLVPLYAVLAGLPTMRARATSQGPTLAVLVATALVGEGWKGVTPDVPLATASLAAPAPVDVIAEGPVLDLPATKGGVRRALWYQAQHGQPVAVDAEGRLAPSVVSLASTLATGGCADPSAAGFRTLVARREGPLRELGPLRACLGDPAWDDGAVAVWRFEGPIAGPTAPD